jgi:hypothetical protein
MRPSLRQPLRRSLFFVAAVVTAAACARENNSLTLPTTDANVTGTFTLTSANGRQLPYTAFIDGTQQWDVTGDKIVIAGDNTWVDSTTYLVTELLNGSSSNQASATSGTYKIVSGQIQFVMTTGGSTIFAGSVTGNTLSVLFNGQPFIYTR